MSSSGMVGRSWLGGGGDDGGPAAATASTPKSAAAAAAVTPCDWPGPDGSPECGDW